MYIAIPSENQPGFKTCTLSIKSLGRVGGGKSDSTVARGRAVYGTPQTHVNDSALTVAHSMSLTSPYTRADTQHSEDVQQYHTFLSQSSYISLWDQLLQTSFKYRLGNILMSCSNYQVSYTWEAGSQQRVQYASMLT